MHPENEKLLKTARVLERAGDQPNATDAYRTFLDKDPRHADAWSDYAGCLLKLGREQEAQDACEAALRLSPQHAAARINLGAAHLRQNRLKEAETHFRSVLKGTPRRVDALLFLADCLLRKREVLAARSVLEDASRPGAIAGTFSVLLPQLAELWARFSAEMLVLQRAEAATTAVERALAFDPQNFRGRCTLGSLRANEGRLDDAIHLFKGVMADHPGERDPRMFLISCLLRKGERDAAETEIAKAIASEPESFDLHQILFGLYWSFGLWADFEAEISRFRKVEHCPAYLDFQQSFRDLLFGKFQEGWAGYEARLRIPPELRPRRTFEQPTWTGEPFPGKTLLVWFEQGFGDTLMFLRYLPQVKALGGKVILEVQAPLLDLAATCPGADILLPMKATLPPFDMQVSLMSLPWVFQTDQDTIPADVPYLDVPPDVPNRDPLLERLEAAGDRTRIGLVWAGNPGHTRDTERSIAVEGLAPLADLPGVVWYSFQVGRPESPPLPNLINLGPFLSNFSDTAYALSGMDLLITVDTSITHLAGALGVPTVLLLAFQPDYRWMLEREDSPWYPSVRLYRQPTYGDWGSVIQKVVHDLTTEP